MSAATVIMATVEAAKADSDRRSVVIRIAIPIVRTPRSIDSIDAAIVRPRRRTGLVMWLVGGLLIVPGTDVAEGLRCTVSRNHDRVLDPES